MSRWKRTVLVVTAMVTVGMTSCSRSFHMRINGVCGERIAISFFLSDTATVPDRLRITQFSVEKRNGSGGWVVLWDVKGGQELSEIVYGQHYDRLEEVVTAKEMTRAGSYRATAFELTWPFPEGQSQLMFSCDETGRIASEQM